MTDKLSTIRAIHARYEAATAEYNQIDGFSSQRSKTIEEKDQDTFILSDVMMKSCEEMDALRRAILYQVPDTWVDAMILCRHISSAYDLLINGGDERPGDKEALSVAIDTLFDYMACEVDQDHEELGPSFRMEAVRVFRSRRLRTGVTDDI